MEDDWAGVDCSGVEFGGGDLICCPFGVFPILSAYDPSDLKTEGGGEADMLFSTNLSGDRGGNEGE